MPPRFSPRDLVTPPEAFWNEDVEGTWAKPRSAEDAEQLLVAYYLSQVSRNVVAALGEIGWTRGDLAAAIGEDARNLRRTFEYPHGEPDLAGGDDQGKHDHRPLPERAGAVGPTRAKWSGQPREQAAGQDAEDDPSDHHDHSDDEVGRGANHPRCDGRDRGFDETRITELQDREHHEERSTMMNTRAARRRR